MSYFNAQKNSTDDLIREAEIDTREVENKYMDTKVGGGGNWETGIDTYTLLILCIKQITNENLPYSTGYSMLCGDLNGKEIQKGGDKCKCIADSLCCKAETYTTL